MRLLRDVAVAYSSSWGYLAPFTVIHLALRLVAAAVIVPLSSLLLAAAIATSGQSALTDQDIARFLLTPAGFAAALALVSLSILASVLDVAVMTNTLRRREHSAVRALMSGLSLVLRRFGGLLSFGARLTLRVLLIAAPFLLVGALVAWVALGQYDINYYLTYKPPAFLIVVAIIGAIALVLAVILISRLSSWAVALHFLLFRRVAPRRSFGESAEGLQGERLEVVGRILTWAVVRGLLAALVAAVAGLLIGGIQYLFGANLRLVALFTLALLLVWGLASAVVSALANGALAALLDHLYRRVTSDEPGDTLPGAAVDPDPRQAVPVRLVLTVAVAAIAGGVYFGDDLLGRVSAERSVEIIAHRGAAGSRPENTMSAVTKALEDHADWVEIDVQETADGQVVVAHDSDFMKSAGVDLKVWDATMDDLAEIDIGSWFDPAYASERTPTLRDVLLAVKDRGRVLIELKYYGHDVELEARVARIVDEVDMSDQIAVMSLKISGAQEMQRLRPHWTYGVLAATAIGDLSALEADFLALNTGQVSLHLIRRARKQGKRVYAWTVDDPLTMSRLISMGVDGLITNEPALARAIMDARNGLSAAERLTLWLSDLFRLKHLRLTAEAADA